MFTYDLILDLTYVSYEEIAYECENLLIYLHGNLQIISEDYQLIQENNHLRIPVTCPEQTSLESRYGHRSARHFLDCLRQKTRAELQIRPTGRAADFMDYRVPVSSEFYLLYGRDFSPVLCGETYQPIPLYCLPALEPQLNSYHELNRWHSIYQSLDTLWSMSHYGEKYALGQMQDVHSPLSRQGIALCRQIEQLTGVPTYYFLTNRRQWSEKQDKARKCPLTGNDWLIEGSTFNDFIGFKSEEARLVSELSSMIRTSKRAAVP